jgi:hypothetical protein
MIWRETFWRVAAAAGSWRGPGPHGVEEVSVSLLATTDGGRCALKKTDKIKHTASRVSCTF